VISLVRKIERRFQPGRQVEELAIDRRDCAGQRAVELIESGACLRWRDRLDQIADRLRLRERQTSVKKRAECELAWFGMACPRGYRSADDRREQYRISVRADLDDVLAGV
jgi:hypothetical protein